MSSFFVTDVTLRELGWPAVLAALAARTATPVGRELALGRRFFDEQAEIEHELARVEEARQLHRKELVIPVSGAEDVRPQLERAAKGAVLLATELLAVARAANAALRVRSFLRARKLEAPLLGREGEGLPALGPLAARLEDALEPSGTVKDSASEALATYRNRARVLHREIQGRIDELVADPIFAGNLRETYFSTRNDRYVLPVNVSFRAKVPGIVHNASQSGQTIFVEPEQIIGLGNELSIAESLAAEEERRVLSELSEDVAGHVDDLSAALARLAALDVAQAAGRLAQELDAAAPRITPPGRAELVLTRLRHPALVLQGKPVVPNRVALAPHELTLVVSGPNAGGKTVTITAVGLCALMLRAGLPIPADGDSALPLARSVLSVIGDAQDLARDLSTFTAHLTRLKDVLEVARAGSLVLVDEIAADTDPREGAAIATAALEHLAQREARVLVTTHLEEVKALGVTDPRFVNARVALDAGLRPTYRLELGAAGMSNAIEVAAQVGLPPTVVEAARQRLRSGSQLSLALTKLEAAQREADAVRDELSRREARSARALAVAAAVLAAAQAERDAVRREAKAELARELEAARAEVGELIGRLQASADMRQAQKAQRELEERAQEARREASRQTPKDTLPAAGLSPAVVLTPGMRVQVLTLDKDGEVVGLHGDDVTVAVGALRTRVKQKDVLPLAGKARAASPARAPASARAVEHRLDLRGQRADDAMRALEAFLDVAYLEGPSQAIVVHGHGTGVLKEALRKMLRESPYVASFRPGDRHEGGDAVTVVELKES